MLCPEPLRGSYLIMSGHQTRYSMQIPRCGIKALPRSPGGPLRTHGYHTRHMPTPPFKASATGTKMVRIYDQPERTGHKGYAPMEFSSSLIE